LPDFGFIKKEYKDIFDEKFEYKIVSKINEAIDEFLI
jgi:hypothetical protein